jgi:hypothetical protein
MADWRKFRFDAHSTFERSYNYLAAIDPDFAVAYACLPRSDTNHWKRSIDAYAKSTVLGNVLIGCFTEPGPAPWERCPGAAAGWRPPRVKLERDGQTFVADDRVLTLPEVDPAHVRSLPWWRRLGGG